MERIYFQPTNLGVYTYANTSARARALRAISRVSRSSFDEIVWEYNRESDLARKAHLAKSYAELTGRDIEARYERLSD